jgi:hypothetical protein
MSRNLRFDSVGGGIEFRDFRHRRVVGPALALILDPINEDVPRPPEQLSACLRCIVVERCDGAR